MELLSIEVNSYQKTKKIVEALSKQGRRPFYEVFFNFDLSRTYLIFYRPIKEVK